MEHFTPVAAVSEIPDPGKKLVELDDALVVLIHAGGQFYCIDDICTHDGGTLYDGELVDTDSGTGAIRCPRHGACFDIRTGQALTMPATEPTRVHDVRVEDDTIYVRLRSEPADAARPADDRSFDAM